MPKPITQEVLDRMAPGPIVETNEQIDERMNRELAAMGFNVPAPKRVKPALRNWTVELMYQVPYYAIVSVKAPTFKEACAIAIAEGGEDEFKACWDASTDTAVTQGARGYDVDLYSNKVKTIEAPAERRDAGDLMEMACRALLDSRQAGGPRRSLRRAIALARIALPHHDVKKEAA